jgi:hypothetical protein
MQESNLSDLVKALEDVQDSVIAKVGTFPKSTIVVARDEKGKKHGHFLGADVWQNGEDLRHEIFLSAESLSRGAKETLGTLLHEMAHSFNHANQIEDVTGDGYHNKKFQSTAERIFSLEIQQYLGDDGKPKKGGVGFSKTIVPDSALIRWSEELAKIEEALKIHALSLNGKAGKGRDKNGVKAVCGCGEIIRLSQKAYDNCSPMCSECEGYFVAE